MNSPIVTIQGTACQLKFGKYRNGTLAIQAFVVGTGEPYMTISVNYEDNWEGTQSYVEAFPFPLVVIKNYSENTGVVQDLVTAGIITDVTTGPYLTGADGTPGAPTEDGSVVAGRLTPEWQGIAQSQV